MINCSAPATPTPRAACATRDHEFLPAALEILETPPSPVRMAFILFIALLVVLALGWAWVGKFDVVATAQGKVQPSGRVKIIQSAVLAKIISPPLANGSQVKAGDILVRLRDTEQAAEAHALSRAREAWLAESIRREHSLATVAALADRVLLDQRLVVPASPLTFPDTISATIRQREQTIFLADLTHLASSLDALATQRQQRMAEASGLRQAIAMRSQLIVTLAERVNMRSSLHDTKSGSRASVIDAIEIKQKEESARAEMQGHLMQAEAAIAVTESEARKLVDAFIAGHRQKHSDAARQIDELTQSLVKAESRLDLMTIKSPVDGEVQASAISTPGQVVQPGAELMRIVPKHSPLEIEAYLPNRDIGFVSAGQPAVIKVEAFPFTRFGTVEGKVLRIATDAIPEPDAQQLEQAAARELRSVAPTGNAQRMQNLVFPVTVQPVSDAPTTGDPAIVLSPGMAVTVEIKTGKRRIIEYLFSPISRITSEAMQER